MQHAPASVPEPHDFTSFNKRLAAIILHVRSYGRPADTAAHRIYGPDCPSPYASASTAAGAQGTRRRRAPVPGRSRRPCSYLQLPPGNYIPKTDPRKTLILSTKSPHYVLCGNHHFSVVQSPLFGGLITTFRWFNHHFSVVQSSLFGGLPQQDLHPRNGISLPGFRISRNVTGLPEGIQYLFDCLMYFGPFVKPGGS